MRRLASLLLVLCILNLTVVPAFAMADDNTGTATAEKSEQRYINIENCAIDCKGGDVKNLTNYLISHLDLGGYTITLDKIIPADLNGEKYWIQYNINSGSQKTPYDIWVYADNGSLKYDSRWNKERLDALVQSGKPYLLCVEEMKEAKKAAYIPFEDSKMDYQRISIQTDDRMRPIFVIMNAYSDIDSHGTFALVMQHVYDKDITQKKQDENYSKIINVEDEVKLDINKMDYSDLETYLDENVAGFKDNNFELISVTPAYADYYFIDSDNKAYNNRLQQKSHLIYGMKINGIMTPYKVEVIVNKDGKIEYRYNFTTEKIKSILNNDFIKSVTIPDTEIQKAVEKCKNTAKDYFRGEKYNIASQEIIEGMDEQLRFYVDVKIIYEQASFKNHKLGIYSRYYVSL